MDALGINIVEFPQAKILGPIKPRLQGLSHHITSVPWQTLQQLLRTGRKILSEGHVKISPWQGTRERLRSITHLQVLHSQAMSQVAPCLQQAGVRFLVVGADPPVNRQRRGDHAIAEESIPNPTDWKNAGDAM